jgi:hypothetical protein
MATRCCVRIHDPNVRDDNDCPVLLYHHHDGNEQFMLPKIEKFLNAAHYHLVKQGYEYAWNSPMVSALFVLLSVEDHSEPIMPFSTDRPDYYHIPHHDCRANAGFPEFLPCGTLYDSLEFIYDIWLLPVSGAFRIGHNSINSPEDERPAAVE